MSGAAQLRPVVEAAIAPVQFHASPTGIVGEGVLEGVCEELNDADGVGLSEWVGDGLIDTVGDGLGDTADVNDVDGVNEAVRELVGLEVDGGL